jgi:hypothetical protein
MPHDERNASADWLELVREKVQSLRFGVVQIVVHDSKVTQIERNEIAKRKEQSKRLTILPTRPLEDHTRRNSASRTSGGSFQVRKLSR